MMMLAVGDPKVADGRIAPTQLVSPPGTTSPLASAQPPYRYIVPLVLGATLALGTVVFLRQTDLDAYRASFAVARTQGAQPAPHLDRRADRDIAYALRELKSRSGLNWVEIASALGVSRRAVHHWTAGERISARHVAQLQSLTQLVARYSGADARQTRAILLAPDDSGRAPIDELNAAAHADTRALRSSQSLADVLEATKAPPADPPDRHEVRPSTLRGRQLGRRPAE